MQSTSFPLLTAGYEPIPGYRLVKPIGRGGFGEVWCVEAPGGLHKAIKFIHRSLDPTQSARELRSLERLRGVNHPFLLTLERFESVEGRLVVVTELAQGSLEDVYRGHCERGSCGIPRATLLKYLHDAADALDYLHNEYQLQHLDVKPGNLLMVGGHVKVADFGLLKDLRDVDCSVVGGLTPTYAPPELFDGRPSHYSDQYSLAVMYQELLTGARPFNGRTIAQLATQHVHSAPNLESLPPGDRPVVARALEKNPERRFGSCLEFVEALGQVDARAAAPAGKGQPGSLVGNDTKTGVPPTTSAQHLGPVRHLSKLSSEYVAAPGGATGHALVLGIGGTGADCLAQLRARIAAHSGTCPFHLHALLIDTDLETISAAQWPSDDDRLPPCTAIHTPLRTPNQYRQESSGRLGSISRRWIYNMPRSGRTEGLRPLGRLALVDHASLVRQRLTAAVEHLAEVASETTPQVYLVGSLGGGTGSGMVWDLAYLLRHLLDEHQLARVPISPLLATGSLSGALSQPLAAADTHAALAEMHHYLIPGHSYPGDDGAGFPTVPAARSPLVDAYVVAAPEAGHLPRPPVDVISDYIWANTTSLSAVLEAARRDAASDETATRVGEPVLRSVGLVRLHCRRQVEDPRLARALFCRMLRRWLGRPAEARGVAEPLAELLARKCGLNAETFFTDQWSPWPVDPAERRQAFQEKLASATDRAAGVPDGPTTLLDGSGKLAGDEEEAPDSCADQRLEYLRRELVVRLRDRRIDLATAMEVLARLTLALGNESERLSAPETSSADSPNPGAIDDATIDAEMEQLHRRWEQQVRGAVARRLFRLAERLDQLAAALAHHAAAIAHALKQLTAMDEDVGSETHDAWSRASETLREQCDPLLERLHVRLSASLLGGPLTNKPRPLDPETLVAAAAEIALPMIQNATAAEAPPEGGLVISDAVEQDIAAAVAAARPRLLDSGGNQRLVLVVGSESERDLLEQSVAKAYGGPVTVAILAGATPVLIHEAMSIPLTPLLNQLGLQLGAEQQIAMRLHTRADIAWNA